MSHRWQHYVPRGYLKAWTAADVPEGHDPYVWLFDKDGSNPRKKAPKNIFAESDMYTSVIDGERDVSIENFLQKIESEFASMMKNTIAHQKPLDEMQHGYLCLFVAAARFRTPSTRRAQSQQWEHPLRVMDDMIASLGAATPSKRKEFASMRPLRSGGPSLSYADVKAMFETPLQTLLIPTLEQMTPQLAALDLAIVEATDDLGFITSDHPCIWFDAVESRIPIQHRLAPLKSEHIEITLPLSPRYCLYLNRAGRHGYVTPKQGIVDEFNRRTRSFCRENFVAASSVTKPIWFEPEAE